MEMNRTSQEKTLLTNKVVDLIKKADCNFHFPGVANGLFLGFVLYVLDRGLEKEVSTLVNSEKFKDPIAGGKALQQLVGKSCPVPGVENGLIWPIVDVLVKRSLWDALRTVTGTYDLSRESVTQEKH